MTRRTLLLGLMLRPTTAPKVHGEVAGHFSATDQEAEEGYFALGQEVMLVVKPGSHFHSILKSLVGKEIRFLVTDANY